MHPRLCPEHLIKDNKLTSTRHKRMKKKERKKKRTFTRNLELKRARLESNESIERFHPSIAEKKRRWQPTIDPRNRPAITRVSCRVTSHYRRVS